MFMRGGGTAHLRQTELLVKGEALRNKFGFGMEDIVLISVGELNRNKNHEVIVKAMGTLKEKRLKYVICGQGELKEHLEKLIMKYKLENQVKLLGYREDIPVVLKMSDIFVFPSCREGLGMAVLEAMASGLPCIVGDNRGTRELITEDKYVLTVGGGKNSIGFARAIQKMAEDVPAGKGYGTDVRKKAACFSDKAAGSEMRKIYSNI